MRILTITEQAHIWEEFARRIDFSPSVNREVTPFDFHGLPYVRYALPAYWDESQEAVVNEIFQSICQGELYVLDWQHDCFLFDPREPVLQNLSWHDEVRDCQVYFPSYYPDGDYYFFLARDFSVGMLGHPWRRELFVFGAAGIDAFDRNADMLKLVRKGKL